MPPNADLYVDITGLEGVAARLEKVKSRMHHYGNTRQDALQDSDIAHPTVCRALDEFGDNWSQGREKISEGLDGIVEMTRAIIEEIQKVDRELEKELEESSQREREEGCG